MICKLTTTTINIFAPVVSIYVPKWKILRNCTEAAIFPTTSDVTNKRRVVTSLMSRLVLMFN